MESINTPPRSEFDIDQLWAEVRRKYLNGAIWWDEDGLRALVDVAGRRHSSENSTRDMLEDKFIFDVAEQTLMLDKINAESAKHNEEYGLTHESPVIKGRHGELEFRPERHLLGDFYTRADIFTELEIYTSHQLTRDISATMKEKGVPEVTIKGARGFRLVRRGIYHISNADEVEQELAGSIIRVKKAELATSSLAKDFNDVVSS